MVILVTGGSGYIGSLLIRRLPFTKEYEGETIRILDNMASGKYHSLYDLPGEVRYELALGDIRDAEVLRSALRDVEVVFDLAGITSVPLSFQRREETMQVNVEGAKKLLDVAVKAGVERVVYSSSAAVYGDVNGLVSEDHPCNPASPYAESKYLAEQVYMDGYRKYGLKVVILRLGTVYGYAPGMRYDTVVNRFAFLAAVGHPLTVWRGAEKCMRPYLYVGDAVNAFIHASLDEAFVGEVFNVVTENATLGEVIGAVRKALPSVKVEVVEPKYAKQISYGLDASKIEALGFKANGNLVNGIKEIVELFRGFT